jgi:hypothetical protein
MRYVDTLFFLSTIAENGYSTTVAFGMPPNSVCLITTPESSQTVILPVLYMLTNRTGPAKLEN